MINSQSNETINKIKQKAEELPVLRFIFSHTVLGFFYGTFLFLYEIKFLREIVPVVHPFLIFWAGIIILYDLVVRRIWEKVPFWRPLALFLISAAITAVLTAETGLISNIKAFVLTALPLFAFYPICLCEKKDIRDKALVLSTIGASVVVFVSSFAAIIMYLMRFSQTITFMGIEETLGFIYYYPNDPESAVILYGAYVDTNHASVYSIVFALLSVALFVLCKKGLFTKRWQNNLGKIYAATNIFVQLCYFPLANSRGGWLSICVALFIVAAIYFYFTKLKISKKAIKAAVSLLLAILCVGVAVLGLLALRTGVSKSTILVENIVEFVKEQTSNSSGGKKPLPETEITLPSADKFNKADDGTGAGRIVIWKETLDLYTERPIFGVGPGNSEYYGMKYDIPGERIKYGADIHNSYLDLLADYGIIGFVLLAAFWIFCAAAILKDFDKNGHNRDISYYACAFTVLFICGGTAFLSCAFINTTAMYFVMLTVTGYLLSKIALKDAKNNE